MAQTANGASASFERITERLQEQLSGGAGLQFQNVCLAKLGDDPRDVLGERDFILIPHPYAAAQRGEQAFSPGDKLVPRRAIGRGLERLVKGSDLGADRLCHVSFAA